MERVDYEAWRRYIGGGLVSFRRGDTGLDPAAWWRFAHRKWRERLAHIREAVRRDTN